MNKKIAALFSVVIILTFIGYIIYDSVRSQPDSSPVKVVSTDPAVEDKWMVSDEVLIDDGDLTSIAAGLDGKIYLGGDSFIICLNQDLSRDWNLKTGFKITALSVSGDTLYAASTETINLVRTDGTLLDEWGPFEVNSIITSVSADKNYVAFADAGTKRVFLLGKTGEVRSMMGQSDEKFIIPSPYFDVALSGDNRIFIANTGMRRVETWSTDGKLLEYFGEPGSAPGAFCGCCNPAHFAVLPEGFITAEKGINRLKIVARNGKFSEFVSSVNGFTASIPLDIAAIDGATVYAANPADSRLYVFKRK